MSNAPEASDNLTTMVRGLVDSMAVLRDDVKNLKGDVKELKPEFDRLNTKVASFAGEMASLHGEMASLQRVVSAMESFPVPYGRPKQFLSATKYHSVTGGILEPQGPQG